jgi:signal transduction histidine kinase
MSVMVSVVERHGGRLTLGDSPSGGLRLAIIVPAADGASAD